MKSAYHPPSPAQREAMMRLWRSHLERYNRQRPPSSSTTPYTQLFPPPNVTGKLHLGHAYTATIQDCALRHQIQRKSRWPIEWVYGTDHAGIATQTLIQRQIEKVSSATTETPLPAIDKRQFMQTFIETNQTSIRSQLKSLGALLDYENEYFTLDARHSATVIKSFVELYDRGLMYRANRLVNWVPHLRTAVADIEVEHEVFTSPTKVKLPSGEVITTNQLDRFEYPLLSSASGTDDDDEARIAVATTRLETMLGDSAVAVHPQDARYAKLIGRRCRHPLIPGRELLIMGSKAVDPSFGTGAVKLTPAHSHADYEMLQIQTGGGKGLLYTIFGDDGTIVSTPENGVPVRFAGKTKSVVREALRKELASLGLFRGTSALPTQSLPRCSRSGDLVEPFLRPNWFLKCKPMAERLLEASRESIDFQPFPQTHRATFEHWLENIQDWCVSRQLWWGHRIPVYYRPRRAGSRTEEEQEVRASVEALPLAEGWRREDDVLDTWFSSALIPRTLGRKEDISLMETGSDILFFWVARMLMLGLELEGRLPFTRVHLHCMVRDRDGRKMSKSLGNVIDPNHVVEGVSLETMLTSLASGNLPPNEVKRASQETRSAFPRGIPECGPDGLRMALASYPSRSQHLSFQPERAVAARHFCNKLWQAAVFVTRFGGDGTSMETLVPTKDLPIEVRWIMMEANRTARVCAEAFEALDLERGMEAAKHFVVECYCDVFIEASKHVPNSSIHSRALKDGLLLALQVLHPLAPYVTDTIYREHRSALFTPDVTLVNNNDDDDDDGSFETILALTYPSWREETSEDRELEATFSVVLDAVRAVRAVRKAEKLVGAAAEGSVFVLRSSHLAKMEVSPRDEILGLVRRLARVEVELESGDDDGPGEPITASVYSDDSSMKKERIGMCYVRKSMV